MFKSVYVYYTYMTKQIQVSDEAYMLLKLYKSKDMSFSDVILSKFRYNCNKTQTKEDLLKKIKSKPAPKKKYDLVSQIDKIVYGV